MTPRGIRPAVCIIGSGNVHILGRWAYSSDITWDSHVSLCILRMEILYQCTLVSTLRMGLSASCGSELAEN